MATYVRPRRGTDPVKLVTVNVDRLTTPADYSLEKTGITQSLLGNWSCRVKFLLSLNRWETPEGSAKNTYYGTMCHKVCESIYQVGRKVMPTAMEIRAIVNAYISKNRKELKVATGDKVELAAGMVETVMGAYCRYYANDLKSLVMDKTESLFRVKTADSVGRPVTMIGRQDGLFHWKGNPSSVWILEHKSMGTVSEDMLKKRLPIDKQCLYYVTAEEMETDYSIGGVLFNIIRRPMLKGTDDITTFLDRLEADINQRPDFYFIRYPVTYSMVDKRRFRIQLAAKFTEVRDFLDGKLLTYRNEDCCESSSNGAPYVCSYMGACANGDLRGYRQRKLLNPELES